MPSPLAIGGLLRTLNSSGIGQLLQLFLGGAAQNRQQNQATEANRRRENEIRGGYDEILGDISGGARSQENFLRNETAHLGSILQRQGLNSVEGRRNLQNQLLGSLDGSNADVMGTLRTRLRNALQNLEGMGQAEQGNIDERYQQNLSNSQQDLAARGLGNSSLRGSVSLAAERERGRESAMLGEELRRERIGIESDLLGDIASAQDVQGTRRFDALASTGQDILNTRDRYSGAQFDLRSALTNALFGVREGRNQNLQNTRQGRLGFIEGITDTYPNNAWLQQIAQQFGMRGAPGINQPSDFQTFGMPLLGGGINAAGNMWGANRIAGAMQPMSYAGPGSVFSSFAGPPG